MTKKQIRQLFRSHVLKRDKFTCQVCRQKKSEEELDAHHITDRSKMPNGGYVPSNGITVCKGKCHQKVETWHSSGEMVWAVGYHPNDLYKLIKSGLEQATKDSEAL